MQRLHSDDTNKRLHSIVGKHTTAAAIPGAGLFGDTFFKVRILIARCLKARDDINRLFSH